MSTPTRTGSDVDRLDDQAIRLLNAILDSASTDVVGVSHWWDRAQTALTTGASAAASFPDMVSAMCRKLQITYALSVGSAAAIDGLRVELAEPGALSALRDHCSRNAVYITALCRLERATRRKKAKANKADEAAALAVPTRDKEPLF